MAAIGKYTVDFLKTIPGKTYNATLKFGTDAVKKWIEIDHQVHKVGRSMAMSANQIDGFRRNVLSNYGQMADRLGMTFAEIYKFQEEYAANVGRSISLTNDNIEAMASLSKLVGEHAVSEVAKNMDMFGASTETASEYVTLNMARAKAQGLDLKKSGEAFANNIKMASRYNFREGINGVSKMTLLSQKLRFNMESIGNAAEKFETIEDAINTAANLQLLGGTYASNFANPLEAMNMAMTDMEGFTNKVIDSFSSKAIFDRETGQVNMSPVDKALMREAAKNLGISFEEAFNIASQKAKIGSIESQLTNPSQFTESDKEWITSKAEYNTETKQHFVTIYENGEEKRIDVSDLTKTQLQIAKDQSIPEKSIMQDVHTIKELLIGEYKASAKNTKSFEEELKGAKENLDITMAGTTIVDGTLNAINKQLNETNHWLEYILYSTLTGIGTGILSGIGNILRRMGLPSRKPSGAPRGGGGLRMPSWVNPKVGARVGGIATAAIIAVNEIGDISEASSSYEEKKKAIESNTSLTSEEKAIAKTQAKKKKNKEIGQSIGSVVGGVGGALAGAKIGASLGLAAGPVGALIGGALGAGLAWGGSKLVGFLGGSIGESLTSEEKAEKSNDGIEPNEMKPMSVETENAISQIKDSVNNIKRNINNSKINPIDGTYHERGYVTFEGFDEKALKAHPIINDENVNNTINNKNIENNKGVNNSSSITITESEIKNDSVNFNYNGNNETIRQDSLSNTFGDNVISNNSSINAKELAKNSNGSVSGVSVSKKSESSVINLNKNSDIINNNSLTNKSNSSLNSNKSDIINNALFGDNTYLGQKLTSNYVSIPNYDLRFWNNYGYSTHSSNLNNYDILDKNDYAISSKSNNVEISKDNFSDYTFASNVSPNNNNIYNTSISSKPSVGGHTYIRQTPNIDINGGFASKNIGKQDINLNINGNLKLVGDKNSVNVDIRKLLEDPVLQAELVNIIKRGLTSGMAGKEEKSSVPSIMGKFEYRGINPTDSFA